MVDSENIDEPEMDEASEEARLNAIVSLSDSILKKRTIAIDGRKACGIEQQWIEDERAVESIDGKSGRRSMLDYASGVATPISSEDPNRSKVVSNISRSKSETAHSRFCDIMLPVDDRNWGLKTTPVPELVKRINDDRPAAMATNPGQPITDDSGKQLNLSDIAKSDMDKAKEAMTGMESVIEDHLTEASYNGECRKLIWNAITKGTGVLHGPKVVRSVNKSWTRQEDPDGTVAYVLDVQEESKPSLVSMDPWNVYPDPECGDDISNAAYIWDYETILPRQLVDLAKLGEQHGYLVDQIYAILDEDPMRITNDYGARGKENQITASKGSHYEKWTYHGDVSREDLLMMGCDCSGNKGATVLSACVVFVNDKPIKAVLNTLDTGILPFYFFQWSTVSGSVWGIGIPRQNHWWDRILTAMWRAMIDNSADSAGAAIIKGAGIEYAGMGTPKIGGKSFWEANDEVDDVTKAFAQFQIKNNQPELQKVIELVLRFVDIETGIPTIFQGEKSEAPETLGATNIMVDSSNVTVRGKVKRFDDQITRPAITAMYHYEMQYHDRDDIKGDYSVDPRGTSVLLAKDIQNQLLLQVFQLKGDPDIAAATDWKKAIKTYYANNHLDIMKSDDELKKSESEKATQAQQGPPQDPRIAGQIQIAEARAANDKEELGLKREQITAEFQFKSDEAEKDRQHQLRLKEIEREMEAMKLSAASGMKLEDIKAQFSQTVVKLNTQKELAHIDSSATKEVLKPPVEPPQHAEDGRSFPE